MPVSGKRVTVSITVTEVGERRINVTEGGRGIKVIIAELAWET